MNDTESSPRKKGRSPGYPGLDIETALQRARELYLKMERHQSNVVVGVGHWGYKFGTGQSNTTLASLKKYGFLEEEGSGKNRKIRLTELAERIIIDARPDSMDKNELVIEAALKPKIHKQLFAKYGYSLPPDENLVYDLRVDLKFTESGARELISQYRRTLSYICSLKSGNASSSPIDKGQPQEGTKPSFKSSPPNNTSDNLQGKGGNVKNIEIPIPHETWPILSGVFPMSEGAWESMMKLLDAMKPGLVKADKNEPQ